MTPEEEHAIRALVAAIGLVEELYPDGGGDRIAAVVAAILGCVAQRYGVVPTHAALVELANWSDFWTSQEAISTAFRAEAP